MAIVLATIFSYAVGWTVKSPPLVPIVNVLAGYPFMIAALRRGEVRVAVARMLVWALAMAVCATLLAYARPWDAGSIFVNGARYRDEMFAWVMTGRGAESTPSQFIPLHARDTALFVAATLVTGGLAGMAMGAALMNYMATYVGSLAAASAHPLAVAILGWHPWSVVRIVCFVVIGVVLSLPLLSRVVRLTADRDECRRLLAWAAGGLLVDVVLKTLLAPTWRNLLLRLAGW